MAIKASLVFIGTLIYVHIHMIYIIEGKCNTDELSSCYPIPHGNKLIVYSVLCNISYNYDGYTNIINCNSVMLKC